MIGYTNANEICRISQRSLISKSLCLDAHFNMTLIRDQMLLREQPLKLGNTVFWKSTRVHQSVMKNAQFLASKHDLPEASLQSMCLSMEHIFFDCFRWRTKGVAESSITEVAARSYPEYITAAPCTPGY